jgi:hypothetical protein
MKTPPLFPLVILAALALLALPASAQLYAPEGANMPGSWSTNAGGGWLDPPQVNAFAGILAAPNGRFLLDTALAQRRYMTTVNVQATGGDITGGSYRWRFTSPSFGTPGGNKWSFNGAVLMDSVQNYAFSGGAADSVTVALTNGNYYTVVYKDAGYVNTQGIWMLTSADPRQIITVGQTPAPGNINPADPVQISVTLNGSPSVEEDFYVRYSTNNFVSSSFLPVNVVGSSGTATIPAFPGGTGVKYYVMSSTAENPGLNTDLKTLRVNNNNRNNYSYAVNGDTLTITATAGPNGSITPSGNIKVFRGNDTTFTFAPNSGFYVDSVIVDGVLLGASPSSYTFDSVTVNHAIRATFTTKANVTFQVNMAKKMRDGAFNPVLGDRVTVRGTFNDWGNSTNNPDTLTDGNADSIYVITKLLKTGTAQLFKFWKTLRGGQDWENGVSDRPLSVGTADTTLPVLFFNDEAFPVNVTFQVNMKVKMFERIFRPDLGDRVTVRGTFNDWGNSTNNPDTLRDVDNDSVYTLTRPVSPGTIQYKFWKNGRGGLDYETISNREVLIAPSPTSLPVVYFDNDSTVSVAFGVSAGWNMISKPVVAANDSVIRLFPGSSIPYAFAFVPSVGYQQRATMDAGVGYWGKFGSGQGVDIAGPYVLSDSIDVSIGWNMVGSISVPVDTGSIVQIPAGILSSVYFGYNAGYAADSIVRPGKAYWVKATAPGKLWLASSGPAPDVAAGIPISAGVFGGMTTVTLTDARGARQTLYITGGMMKGFDINRFEMPPAAPEGAFDVRFASQRMVEVALPGVTTTLPVAIRTDAWPVTVNWTVQGGVSELTLRAGTTSRAFAGSGSLQLAGPSNGGVIIEVNGAEVPKEFALMQNYPNPFNPSTTISYGLAADALTTVKVFDILGRQIATLVDEVQPAGFRTVEWNGRNATGIQVATGVYFYRLEAAPITGGGVFSSLKKMILVK